MNLPRFGCILLRYYTQDHVFLDLKSPKKCLKKVQKKAKMPIETGAKVAPKTSKKEQKREKYRLKLEQSGSKKLQKLDLGGPKIHEKWKIPEMEEKITDGRTNERTDERTQNIFVRITIKNLITARAQ